MTEKKDLIFINHILGSIDAIEDFSNNLSKEELFSNRLKQSAIVREIEIIGEAVKNISDSVKRKYNKIQWNEISGTRDKIIYHYFGVDLNIIWDIIKKDIPELKKEILGIRKKIGGERE